MRPPLLLYVFLAICYSSSSLADRERRCCRYSDTCPSTQSCILSDLSFPSNCSVLKDSKKDHFSDSEGCDAATFVSHSAHLESSAFRLRAYVFSSGPRQFFPGLDLQIDYSKPWDQVGFRFMNLDGNSTSRCVDIQRTHEPSPGYLNYDCEAGFYVFGPHQIINTAGSTYRLDICLSSNSVKRCGSYLFTMPNIQQVRQEPTITLIDRELLLDDFIVSLHSPRSDLQLAVFSEKGSSKELIYKYNYTDAKLFSFAQLAPGYYTISSSHYHESWTQIAHFSIDESRLISVNRIAIILLAIGVLLALISFCVSQKLFRCRDKYYALPNDPFKKDFGTNVVIISDVNHPEHSDVLLQLSRYLQVQSGICKVFYAMDPETGIMSQTNHNPWLWAQEVIEGINSTKDYIVFAASPSSELCSKLYENLCENQTLMSTKVLAMMAKDNRVSIIDFPYSLPSSISQLVPRGVPSIPHYAIPHQMNDFLRHIQGSSGNKLLSKLSCDFLHNEVAFLGSEESSILIQRINTLSFKVKKLSLKDEPKVGSLLPLQGLENELLSKVSVDSELLMNGGGSHFKTKKKESALEFEIEKNILSLKGGEMVNRDTSVNVEFA